MAYSFNQVIFICCVYFDTFNMTIEEKIISKKYFNLKLLKCEKYSYVLAFSKLNIICKSTITDKDV